MRSRVLAVVALVALAVTLSGVVAGAGSRRSVPAQVTTNILTINALFTGGTPTGALQIQRSCTTGGVATFPVASPGTVDVFDMNLTNDCIVTATVVDGADAVSYSCTAALNMACAAVPAQNEVLSGQSGSGGTGTITVTFNFPPLVVAPAFTG